MTSKMASTKKKRSSLYTSGEQKCRNFGSLLLFALSVTTFVNSVSGYAVLDIRQDEKAKLLHRLDTLNILAYVSILILIVCTIWLFKHKRVRFIHETGLAVVYGLIVGAIIRYAGSGTEITQIRYHLLYLLFQI